MNTVSDDESEGEDAVTREKSKHSLINESTGTGTSPMQTPGRWDREQINFGSYSFNNTGRHSPWFSRASLGDSARAFHFNLILSSNWSNYSNHSLFYWKLRYPRGGGSVPWTSFHQTEVSWWIRDIENDWKRLPPHRDKCKCAIKRVAPSGWDL